MMMRSDAASNYDTCLGGTFLHLYSLKRLWGFLMALSTMSEARARFSKYLLLHLTPDDLDQFEPLRALLTQYPGRCAVQVKYKNGPVEQMHPLPSTFAVLPEDNLLDALTALLKPEDVSMCY